MTSILLDFTARLRIESKPRLLKFGTFKRPILPMFASPLEQEFIILPNVFAPSSPKSLASGAPPQPTESITIKKALLI
jgi:hypothetical protein